MKKTVKNAKKKTPILQELQPGVAPILQEAPRVSSGSKNPTGPFAPLLAYRSKTKKSYTLERRADKVKLRWSGVRISPGKLAELLKTLPRGLRIEGSTRIGEQVASLSFDGKLRRGQLSPPRKDGLLIVWTEPQTSFAPLEEANTAGNFEPQGERLGVLRVEKGGQRIKATIYRSAELENPGFVLVRKGRVRQQGLWFDCLEDPSSARFCQVVVEGDVEWGPSLPPEFRGTFRKLAKLAAQRSQELEATSAEESRELAPPDEAPKLSSDMVDRLLETPKFLAAYQNQKNGRPPVVTLSQILKLLCHGGGQLPLQTVKERIGLPEHRLTEILHQMDSILRAGEEVALSLSLDGRLLLLDQERLRRLFALQAGKLDDEKVVRSETVDGGSRELCLPLDVDLKERRVLEALLRYGRMSEGELAQILGTRRVGGLLEKLLSRLEDLGFYGLAIVGESDQGRIFQIQA